MNEVFKRNIIDRDHEALINYEALGAGAKLAIPTPDHYYPLMYTLGLQEAKDDPTIFNDTLVAGSASMTSVQMG